MNVVVNLDKLFDGVKEGIKSAQSTDEIDELMDDASKFLRICFVCKED